MANKFFEERKLILSVIIFVSRDRGKGSSPKTGRRDNCLEEKIKSDHFSPRNRNEFKVDNNLKIN